MTESTTRGVASTLRRPVSFDDLAAYDSADVPLLDVHDSGMLVDIPGALVALGTLLDVLRGAGIAIDATRATIAAKAPRDEAELQTILDERQRTYDTGHDLYAQYLADPDSVDMSVARYAWAFYLRREGIDNPAALTPKPAQT